MKTADARHTCLLYSGNYFDFADPEGSVFTIEDIAHALSQQCRYNGHCIPFYSVAEHSVLASFLVDEADAYDTLMHDAPEAFMGDVPSPLKSLLPDYKKIYQGVEDVVFRRFGVKSSPAVKAADLRMLAIEESQIMVEHSHVWPCNVGANIDHPQLRCLPPHEARTLFMDRYYQLNPMAA